MVLFFSWWKGFCTVLPYSACSEALCQTTSASRSGSSKGPLLVLCTVWTPLRLYPTYFGRDGPTMHFAEAVCSYPRRIRGRLRSPWTNRGRVLRIVPRFQRPVKRTWIVESLDGRMNRVIAGHGRISSAEGMRWTRSVDPRATIRATTATRVLRSPPPSETVCSRDFLTAARLSHSIKVQVSVVQQNMNP